MQLYRELAECVRPKKINVSRRWTNNNELWERFNREAINIGWLEAAAEAHNHEMHVSSISITTRVPQVAASRSMFGTLARYNALENERALQMQARYTSCLRISRNIIETILKDQKELIPLLLTDHRMKMWKAAQQQAAVHRRLMWAGRGPVTKSSRCWRKIRSWWPLSSRN